MGRISAWAEHRTAPVVGAVAMLIGSLSYSLFAHQVEHGGPRHLLAPGDLWSLAASATALVRGQFSHIYVHGGALTSPPALEFLLAPVILAGHALGLDPHFRSSGVSMSLWYVLGPAAIVIGSTPLFAADAVARHWGFSDRRRMLLALAGGLGAANVAYTWGHPEDCVSVALVMWAALALDRAGPASATRTAWLLGVAIAFQPLAVLGVAPVLARLGWRAAARLSPHLLFPSILVLVPPLIGEAHRTLFVLVHQPFQPHYISDTPLTHLAPTLSPGVAGGGPTRLVATLVSVALCIVVCRRRHHLETVLAMTALSFFLRVLLETALNWYYFWPVAALCLLLSLRGSVTRYWLCTAAVVLSLVLGNHRVHHIVLWWPAIMATTVAMLLTVFLPPRRRVRGHDGARAVGRAP
jgi:hypothetical protein